MTADVYLHKKGVELSKTEEERIDRQIEALETRLKNFKNPRIDVTIDGSHAPQETGAKIQVSLRVDGKVLASEEKGVSADTAVKAAMQDVKRQLEKEVAKLRGEDTYGVPSRRLPDDLRPNPIQSDSEFEETD